MATTHLQTSAEKEKERYRVWYRQIKQSYPVIHLTAAHQQAKYLKQACAAFHGFTRLIVKCVSEDLLGSHDESFLLKCKGEVNFPFFFRGYSNRARMQRPAKFILSGNCPASKHHGSSITALASPRPGADPKLIHRRGLLIRHKS